MIKFRCACGYTTADEDDFTDHFLEAFTPPGDRAADGQLHAEAAHDNRSCLCGYAVAGPRTSTPTSWPSSPRLPLSPATAPAT